jgi:hypothetical protein
MSASVIPLGTHAAKAVEPPTTPSRNVLRPIAFPDLMSEADKVAIFELFLMKPLRRQQQHARVNSCQVKALSSSRNSALGNRWSWAKIHAHQPPRPQQHLAVGSPASEDAAANSAQNPFGITAKLRLGMMTCLIVIAN